MAELPIELLLMVLEACSGEVTLGEFLALGQVCRATRRWILANFARWLEGLPAGKPVRVGAVRPGCFEFVLEHIEGGCNIMA
jgi:hypothetical protein